MANIDDDQIIISLQEGLKKLLDTQAWASEFISQWCLAKLFKASKELHNWDFKEACNFWLRCQGIRFGLDIVGHCYHKFNEPAKDLFMSNLLKMFTDNRPRFDWCVAYLASLSPGKFVSSIIRAPEMFTPILIPHTVAFIEHLSLMKSQNLNILLKEVIEGCLDADQLETGKHYTVECVSNLILISFHSELYAQVMIEVFLEAVENKKNRSIERLKENFESQRSGFNFESFQKMIPELITRAKMHGTRLLLIFAEKLTGEDSNSWLTEMLEVVLICLQMHATKMTSCPLMDELKKDTTWSVLWKSCLSDNHIVQQTAVRLILISTNEKHSLLYNKTIEKLLSSDSSAGFSALVKILEPPLTISDVPDVTRTFAHILQMLSIDVNSRDCSNRSYYMLKNILALLNLEKNQFQHFKNARIKMALQTNANHLINIWSSLLKNLLIEVEQYKIQNEQCAKRMKLEVQDLDEMEIAEFEEEKKYSTKDHNILLTQIIDCISPIVSMNMSDLIKCAKLTVKNFFWCLIDADAETRMSNLNHCYSLLNKQCYNKKTIRSVALRDLVEGALFLYPNLFGAPDHDKNNQLKNNSSDSLLKYNQRKGISLNISKSSMLHAGVIGFGLQKIKESWSPNGLDEEMKNFFIKAILSCCSPMEESISVNANKIVMDGLCQLSNLLVELVSNDVLYNGIIWPEEDFKTTIERDLHIRRTFKNCPILWALMGVLATYRQPLRNCGVFLTAIGASVIHHWQAKSTENVSGNNTELYFFTVKLLEILSLGQMLPHPLTYLHQVIEYLQPNEIAYVLRECVWNFMAANSSTINETSDSLGNKKVSPAVSDQFIDPLRNTMQKKLNILGNLYHQMFIAACGQDCESKSFP